MKSLAIPSTCIGPGSCKSQQQASHIAHQIGRMAMHFGVEEIVIYDCKETEPASVDEPTDQPKKIVFGEEDNSSDNKEKEEELSSEAERLAQLLQFYITPSYLRNVTFENGSQFQYAKKLPKLPRLPFINHKTSRYMEGLTIPGKVAGVKKYKKGQKKSKKQLELAALTKYVTIGSHESIELSKAVPVNTRVTVDTKQNTVVSPKEAYKCAYFGYAVRVAKSFGKVFTECVDTAGYSLTVYVPSCQFVASKDEVSCTANPLTESSMKDKSGNILLVFGKWSEINNSVKQDKQELESVEDASLVFDGRIDTTTANLRVEDAITVALSKVEGFVGS